MKKIIATLVLLVGTTISYAQGLKVNSKIETVTVFQQGAQVNRSGQIILKAGINQLSIPSLSRHIDQNSIQIKIPGAKIISLNYHLDYLNNEDKNGTRKALQSKIDQLEYRLKELTNEKLGAEQQLKLIEQNVQIKGQAVLDVADLEEFLAFYRKNIPLIRGNILVVEQESEKVKTELKELQAELRGMGVEKQLVEGVIDIEVGSNNAKTEQIEISYYVRNASWVPYYNVRAKGINEDLTLEFNGNVYQTTGEDWENVQLTLATGTPQLSGTAPQLFPWHLNFQELRISTSGKKNSAPEKARSMEAEVQMMDVTASWREDENTLVKNLTFREYKIATPYNVRSDGQGQRVEISVSKVPASYEYQAIPKLNDDVFLMAYIPNWESYNLMSGMSKIYFEDTYVGEAYLDAKSVDDTLAISLGQDKNILVERTILLDKCEKKMLGSKQVKKRHVQISLRNNKNIAVKVKVLDQIPVSQREEIKVDLSESSGAIYNEQTGELKWEISLQPAESSKKHFEFEVTYPKGKTINL